ncbi:MAG: hypothetical protein IPP48_04770 [Chitinophagaceae bacterium]|nr:hypothetical protein [Chitinophagaceae bacterium]
MKKILLMCVLFAGSFITAKAQEEQPGDDFKKNEKIQALYVAYVTKELNLTSEEAQKFWPVHNEFENELRGIKKDLPELEKEQLVLNVKKKYQGRFNGILGTNRCERLFRMRAVFQKKLVERFRKQRQNNQPPRMRRGV